MSSATMLTASSAGVSAAMARPIGEKTRSRSAAENPSAVRALKIFSRLEALPPRTAALICGAGHVGRALAPVLAAVGLDVVVLDDRPEFAAAERLPDALRVVRLATFDDAFAGLTITSRCFVVLVTRGHAHDFSVVEQALRTEAGYIGLMGSAAKREKIFRALAADGFSDADLARIFSPIDVAIAAETPAELAVSIAAELSRERAAMAG
jgi:xanthine dehydrogenase accessory factor